MAEPTPMEQLMLELTNRLRTDPLGEYDRLVNSADYALISSAVTYFGVDLDVLEQQLIALVATHPLAWNEALHTSASAHNALMIEQDRQDHVLPGEQGLADRFEAAGYTGWNRIGENIYAYSSSVFYGHAGFVVDWGYDDDDFVNGQLRSDWRTNGDGIQDGAGHRVNLMSANFSEIGIAITEEDNANTQVGPLVITQDLGNRFNYQAQFVGSVIDDLDHDDFYDVGEGLGGVTVTLRSGSNSYTTTTWGSGGYQIAVPAGTYEVTFSGGGLDGAIVVNATLGSVNAYLSVEAADAVTDGEGVTSTGTAGDDVLVGTAFGDVLDGLAGADTMTGGGGDDLYYVDNAEDAVVENAGEGNDTVISSVDYTLAAHVEDLELQGNARVGRGNNHDNVIAGSAESSARLYGNNGKDSLFGNGFSDRLSGGAQNDRLWGRGGDDLVQGGTGNDRLFGQAGNDNLQGGRGHDRLDGGSGKDLFAGGTGADLFLFDDGHFAGRGYSTADRIIDFNAVQGDRISLAAVDADRTKAGDQAFSFVGTGAFSGTAGELRYASNGAHTLLAGDTDGDGVADFAIRLDGVIDLTADMFLL